MRTQIWRPLITANNTILHHCPGTTMNEVAVLRSGAARSRGVSFDTRLVSRKQFTRLTKNKIQNIKKNVNNYEFSELIIRVL